MLKRIKIVYNENTFNMQEVDNLKSIFWMSLKYNCNGKSVCRSNVDYEPINCPNQGSMIDHYFGSSERYENIDLVLVMTEPPVPVGAEFDVIQESHNNALYNKYNKILQNIGKSKTLNDVDRIDYENNLKRHFHKTIFMCPIYHYKCWFIDLLSVNSEEKCIYKKNCNLDCEEKNNLIRIPNDHDFPKIINNGSLLSFITDIQNRIF